MAVGHGSGDRVIDHWCGVKKLYSAQVGMIALRSVYTVRHPRGSHIAPPLLSLEVATPEKKFTEAVTHVQVHFSSGS